MNAPIPSAGLSSVPSVNVIFLLALKVSKQYHGRPRLQARHCPHTARQLRMTKSPTSTCVTASPTVSTMPCGLVAEEERVFVVYAAVAVGEVGVALHPARRDLHDHIVGTGSGNHDVDDLRRRSLGS